MDLRYKETEAGGRKSNDGVGVKWKLSRSIPTSGSQSSPEHDSASSHQKVFPSFGHDVTARDIPVSFDNPEEMTHPCCVTAISAVDIGFLKCQYREHVNLYEKLLAIMGKAGSDECSYGFEAMSPRQGLAASTIIISAEEIQEKGSWQRNRGDCHRSLRLYMKSREGYGLRALGS